MHACMPTFIPTLSIDLQLVMLRMPHWRLHLVAWLGQQQLHRLNLAAHRLTQHALNVYPSNVS